MRKKEDQYEQHSFATEYRHFRAHFGIAPSTCALLWKAVSHNHYILPPKGQPEHLLWALLYLKLYDSDEVLADLVGVDVKTFCKWSWSFVLAIAKLKPQVVSILSMCICEFLHCVADTSLLVYCIRSFGPTDWSGTPENDARYP